MEKELENYINLENQIDKIIDLVSQLKEENRQLHEQNELLMIQSQTASDKKYQYIDDSNMDSVDTSAPTQLTKSEFKMVRRRVKNALLKLEQLRQAVMEAS